jgi:hypothetical protein
MEISFNKLNNRPTSDSQQAYYNAGAGAKAAFLTQFIVPKQHLPPGGDKRLEHVSKIVLIESVLIK